MTASFTLNAAPSPDAGELPPPCPAPVERLYFPALDGVRFLAFFLVFLHHLPPVDAFTTWSPTFSLVIQRISLFGWLGVDLFLTLSGFLIATLLLRELDTTGTLSVRRFYVRRMLRIWPLYYLVLTITIFLTPVLFGQAGSSAHRRLLAEHLFPYATFFGNFSYAILKRSVDAMNPSSATLSLLWTVAMEEQFYLVIPFVMLAAGHVVTLRKALPYAIGLIAFSIATRYYIQANGIAYPMVWMNTLAHLDPIVLGIIGALIWRQRQSMPRLPLFGAEIVLAIAAFWAVMAAPPIGTSLHTAWQVALGSVGALLLIGAVLRYRSLSRAFGWRPLAWLGRISYGLYVYHILARHAYQYVFVHAVPAPLIPWAPVRFVTELLLILLVTVAFAAISYYCFERKFLLLKERFAIIPSRPA